MSESKPEAKPKTRNCEGWACRETKDIRFDQISKKWLCVKCWARVDPSRHGLASPE